MVYIRVKPGNKVHIAASEQNTAKGTIAVLCNGKLPAEKYQIAIQIEQLDLCSRCLRVRDASET